jgi:hypothetical protein
MNPLLQSPFSSRNAKQWAEDLCPAIGIIKRWAKICLTFLTKFIQFYFLFSLETYAACLAHVCGSPVTNARSEYGHHVFNGHADLSNACDPLLIHARFFATVFEAKEDSRASSSECFFLLLALFRSVQGKQSVSFW